MEPIGRYVTCWEAPLTLRMTNDEVALVQVPGAAKWTRNSAPGQAGSWLFPGRISAAGTLPEACTAATETVDAPAVSAVRGVGGGPLGRSAGGDPRRQRGTAVGLGAPCPRRAWSHLCLANFEGDLLSDLSTATGALVKTVSAARFKFDGPAAIDGDGTQLWVANRTGASLSELPLG